MVTMIVSMYFMMSFVIVMNLVSDITLSDLKVFDAIDFVLLISITLMVFLVWGLFMMFPATRHAVYGAFLTPEEHYNVFNNEECDYGSY